MAATNPCPHTPQCPPADRPDREAALTVARHMDQGWSRLCNGVVVFEDTGELLPDGQIVAPHRPTDVPAEGDLFVRYMKAFQASTEHLGTCPACQADVACAVGGPIHGRFAWLQDLYEAGRARRGLTAA